MATTRPFTRNTGSVISGTEQLVNLAIGISQQEYANDLGGVKWWMGPDEDLGYIVTKEVPSGTQPNPVSSDQATVAFERSSIKTELSFVEMVNELFSQNFTTGNQAKTWLNSNGYWTSWEGGIPPGTYSIGQAALGGKIAYILQPGDPGYDAGNQHGIVATVADISANAIWGCADTLISGADGIAIGTGNQNTIDILAGCATAGIAARLCSDLVEGGYSDWYLPSKNELNKVCLNKDSIGGFAEQGLYWSSTELDQSSAWYGNFTIFQNCTQATASKINDPGLRVRAIRSF